MLGVAWPEEKTSASRSCLICYSAVFTTQREIGHDAPVNCSPCFLLALPITPLLSLLLEETLHLRQEGRRTCLNQTTLLTRLRKEHFPGKLTTY